jgi:hypothetical protein
MASALMQRGVSMPLECVVLRYLYAAAGVDTTSAIREAHRDCLRQALHDGTIIMGGALGDPASGEMFVFRDLH